jgi:hypothetical protein
MAKLLPRLQLIFAILFGAIALFGPVLVSQSDLIILSGALAGVLLGAVTFLIGWRLEFAKGSVIYPFAGWSRGILTLFLNPKQARGLQPANVELSPLAREAIGIFSLAFGPLLAIVLIIAVLVLFN